MIDINRRVKNLVKKHDTCNPYRIAAEKNIAIMAVPLEEKVRGFWRRVLKRKYIFVNDKLSETAQRIVVGHELGHILLHPHYRYFCMAGRTYFASARHEAEANDFAIRLLSYSYNIDPNEVVDLMRDNKPPSRIVHMILAELITE
jgi:Zn-dependent peptidase ImmA (M78 family)